MRENEYKDALLQANLDIMRLNKRIEALHAQKDGCNPIIDCRQCVSGSDRGCDSVTLCVDAVMFKPKYAIQYWIKSGDYRRINM